MKKLLPLLFILLLFTSCRGVWMKSGKDAFFEACMDDTRTWLKDPGQARTYCECVTTKVLVKYPDVSKAINDIESISAEPEMQKCKPATVR